MTTRTMLSRALLISLAMGCGANDLDGAGDQDPVEVAMPAADPDDLTAYDYTPDAEDAAELDRQEALGDAEDGGFSTMTAAAHRCHALQLAKSHLGVNEDPFGSNAGPPLKRYTRWFYPSMGPQPWCAFFVSWAIDRTGDGNHKVPWANPGYVPTVYEWMRGRGRLVQTPKRCDIFFYGSLGHIGYVTAVNPRTGSFRSVEGNYNHQVIQVTRNYKRGSFHFARY
jgi:hypothetical protein